MRDLKELAEHAYRTAKSIAESGKEVTPVFMAEEADGTPSMFLCPWTNGTEKARTFAALRERFAEMGTLSYVFVCEAWVVRGDAAKEWDGVMPSEHPERVEVLMVDGNNVNGESVSIVAEIHNEDGRRVVKRIESPIHQSGGHSAGQAFNLLKPMVPSPMSADTRLAN